MADSVQILGLEDMGRTMDLLTQKVQRQMVRKATNAGAEVYRREIRARVPVRQDKYLKGKNQRGPGYLKKHIGRTGKATRDGEYVVSVGPMAGAFYWRFRELGSSHEPAQPVIRPVFDTKTPEAENKFAETLKADIAAELVR